MNNYSIRTDLAIEVTEMITKETVLYYLKNFR